MGYKVGVVNYAQEFNDSYERIFSIIIWNNCNVDAFFEDFFRILLKASTDAARTFDYSVQDRRK
ncbi:MAG: hypothetical protein ACI92E_000689 [Oceanicoccus sp.]|jgi:hypothetical protein